MLVRIKNWERYGLKSWIEAAKKRLHHNVLAIAFANKLARIAWAVLAKGRAFELTRTDDARRRPTHLILAPCSARSRHSLATPEPAASQARRPALTAPARDAIDVLRAGTKERPLARTKELRDMRSKR